MSKKILVEANILSKMFGAFFKAKENGRGDEFKDNLRKQNAELGKVWDKYDSDMEKTLLTTKRMLIANKLDTTEIDDLLKKYY